MRTAGTHAIIDAKGGFNALEVDLDEYLQPYRKGMRESAAAAAKPA